MFLSVFSDNPNESILSECAVKGSCEKCLITVLFPAFVNTFFTIYVTFIFSACHFIHFESVFSHFESSKMGSPHPPSIS